MIASEAITSWLVEWFEKNSLISKSDLESLLTENYFEKGWIDSFKFISFIMDIEENFKINFSNDEFQNRNFSTIIGLVQIITNKVNQKCL